MSNSVLRLLIFFSKLLKNRTGWWLFLEIFWSHFATFGAIFDYFLIPGGIFGELWAHFWGQKMVWGTKHVPRLPQEVPSWIRPHPFGYFLGVIFRIFFVMFVKKKCFWNMYLLFFNFWVALSVPWDVLICNSSMPAQSKNTFSVLHCFWKIAP